MMPEHSVGPSREEYLIRRFDGKAYLIVEAQNRKNVSVSALGKIRDLDGGDLDRAAGCRNRSDCPSVCRLAFEIEISEQGTLCALRIEGNDGNTGDARHSN
jgi:hypothetical protein